MGDSNALYNILWKAADFMYMRIGCTLGEPAQYTKHTVVNGTRSGSNTCQDSRNSGGSSGHYDQNPRGRTQGGSSNSWSDQFSRATSHAMRTDESDQQQQQSGSDNSGKQSSKSRPMGDCNNHNDILLSIHGRSRIANSCSQCFNLSNQGWLVIHPAWHLFQTVTIYRWEHEVILQQPAMG